MPSVASESHTLPPSRSHLPSARSHSDADARQPATPFADLLDSTPPAAEPPPAPRQSRSERPERADPPKRTDDRSADTKSAQDSTDTKDSKAADGTGDTKNAKDPKDGKAADASKDAKDGEAAAAADAGGKPKPDADQTAALDAMFADAATPAVTVPQATVVAVAQPLALAAATVGQKAPEADALAALEAAGQGPRVSPDAAPKPGQAQGDKHDNAEAKGAASANPQTAVPEIESGKDAHARGNGGDKASGEFRHAAADLLAKLDNAPVQQGGDTGGAVKAGADAVQNLAGIAPAGTAAPASAPVNAPGPSAAQAPAIAVPLSGLAVEITTQAHAGRNHFEIRLDPPELGRIDVKLDVDGDGNVSTRLVVDRADTLDLLKRDASTLERALQQAGLKTSDHALEFSLRQQAFAHDDTAAQNGTQLIIPDDDSAPLEAMRQGYGRLLGLGGGLDIKV